MDAKTLRADLERAGFRVQAEGIGIRIEPKSALTAEIRSSVMAHKPGLLRLLSEESEIRAHVARVFPDHPEAGEALAVALANPGAALDAFRLAKDREAWAVGTNPEGRA